MELYFITSQLNAEEYGTNSYISPLFYLKTALPRLTSSSHPQSIKEKVHTSVMNYELVRQSARVIQELYMQRPRPKTSYPIKKKMHKHPLTLHTDSSTGIKLIILYELRWYIALKEVWQQVFKIQDL